MKKLLLILFVGFVVAVVVKYNDPEFQAQMRKEGEEREAREKEEAARRAAELSRRQEAARRNGYRLRTDTAHWYTGGTLHKVKMSAWNAAPYENRLATAGDFAATMSKKSGQKIESMDRLRELAKSLEANITEAGRGGVADTQDVSAIAAAVWILASKGR